MLTTATRVTISSTGDLSALSLRVRALSHLLLSLPTGCLA